MAPTQTPAQTPADDGYPNFCGICNQLLAGDLDEKTCPAGHTPEQIAEYAAYCTGGEDHLDSCEQDKTGRCTCGGERCGSSFTTGPAHDPSGTSCDYIRRDHPTIAEGAHGDPIALHRGADPLGGNPGDMIEWTGGGTCAGDALPHRIVRRLWACPLAGQFLQPSPVADEDLAVHMRQVHGWTVFLTEQDDPMTLRAMHRAALDNLTAAGLLNPPPVDLHAIREQEIRKAIGRAAEALAEAADRSPVLAAEGEVIGIGDGTSGFLMRFEGAIVRVTIGPASAEETDALDGATEAAEQAERSSDAAWDEWKAANPDA